MEMSQKEYNSRRGRLAISFIAAFAGKDSQILITGGDSHIGASAMSIRGAKALAHSVPGHMEGELASGVAQKISLAMNNVTVVTAGIHYENISKSEILDVLAMCAEMADNFLRDCQSSNAGFA